MKYEKLEEIKEKEEYLKLFASDNNSSDGTSGKNNFQKQKQALEKALDIRKFEIELYWKRGAYFWAFIALTFTSYFIIITTDTEKTILSKTRLDELAFLLNLFGLFLSVAWFLVNRGSKYWQENWEKHVDLLEDEIIGPLYKTTMKIENGSFNPLASSKRSVGKINQLISFLMIFIWLTLLIQLSVEKFKIDISISLSSIFFIVVFFLSFCALLFFTKSSESNGNNLNMVKRKIK